MPWQEPVMVNFLFKRQHESCYIHCEEEDGTRTQTAWFIKRKTRRKPAQRLARLGIKHTKHTTRRKATLHNTPGRALERLRCYQSTHRKPLYQSELPQAYPRSSTTLKRNAMSDRANICRFNPARLADITRPTHFACGGCFCCSHGDATQAVAIHLHEH